MTAMNRVLIVDDEYIGREMLRESVRWEDYGYTVVGEARNGIEAMKQIERLKPDVVFTDIRMPGMDGIELIRWIGAQKRFMLCVAISSYEEFTYVQQSFREGVVDYLTKLSFQSEDVARVLKKLDGILDERRLQVLGRKAVERRRWLDMLLNGRGDRAERLRWNRTRTVTCLVIAIDGGNEASSQAICDALERKSGEGRLQMAAPKDRLALCVYRLNTARFDAERAGILREIRAACEAAGVDGFIGVSDPFSGEGDLHTACLQAMEVMNYSLYCGANACAAYSEIEALGWGGFDSRRLLDVERIRMLIQTGEGAAEAREQILTAFRENVRRRPDNDGIRLTYQEYMTQLRSLGQGEHHSVDDKVRQCYDRLCTESGEARSLAQMEANLTSLLDCAVEARSGDRGYGSYVAAAIRYIDEHIADGLSLNTVADAVGISRVYLSQLFSREMNVTFSEFVLLRRIQRAKWLLRNTKKRIYEISEEAGFGSETHFSAKFKEVEGCSPKDYRRKHGS